MNIPSSTYRIQFHKGFTFNDLYGIIGYLDKLGISTIYASPVFGATPGSMHGYDVTDPHTVSPEIGTLDELRRIAKRLKEKGMSWIQDIVPNHMAMSIHNGWLMDVFERGPLSPYYRHFDIDWDHPATHLHGRMQLPVLGDPLDDCLENGQITVSFSEKGFILRYFDHIFPLSLPAIKFLFNDGGEEAFSTSRFIAMAESARDAQDWLNDKETYLSAIFNDHTAKDAITNVLTGVNDDRHRLREVIDHLYYMPCFWKDSESEINYRRFFTVNELICLRMEDEEVFRHYHQFVYALYNEGLIQGLRIDHIDGLYDPDEYISRLRSLFGNECYIIAEKILELDERVPERWKLQGTSGYEFLSHLNQLFTNRKGVEELMSFYRSLVPELPAYGELVARNKRMVFETYMGGEWDNLARRLAGIPGMKHFVFDRIKNALAALMVAFPVYRIYPTSLPLQDEEAERLRDACQRALGGSKEYKPELDRFLELCLVEEPAGEELLHFLKRLMQFTGPLTAKGVEDTTFYVYNALISHDEVGDAPSRLAISVNSFHERMQHRRRHAARSLNATSTHDTKRGEDARLRLNLLADYTTDWISLVKTWFEMNAPLRTKLNDGDAPTVNDEYYIYQAITGGFPHDFIVTDEWLDRLVAYEVKALREAKVNTNWSDPNEPYEKACENFIRSIVDETAFMETFVPFVKRLVKTSHRSACAHVLLKITAPGIPDIYQGCELWDLSFVDPDNRRPVDYTVRMDMLDQVRTAEKRGSEDVRRLLEEHRADGLEKLFVTHKALTFRRHHAGLFEAGEYLPLDVTSSHSVIVAFARRLDANWALVIATLTPEIEIAPDDHLSVPEEAPNTWTDIFTGETFRTERLLRLNRALGDSGIALLSGN